MTDIVVFDKQFNKQTAKMTRFVVRLLKFCVVSYQINFTFNIQSNLGQKIECFGDNDVSVLKYLWIIQIRFLKTTIPNTYIIKHFLKFWELKSCFESFGKKKSAFQGSFDCFLNENKKNNQWCLVFWFQDNSEKND